MSEAKPRQDRIQEDDERASRGRVRRLLAWIGAHEPQVLASLLLIAAAVWAFAELADDVLEGETAGFDERVLLSLRTSDDSSDPLGPGWFEEMARDITALGGIGVLTLITLASAGYLLLYRKAHTALYLVLAIGGGILASTLLKSFFDRARPDLVPHGQIIYTSSFPSGHSMMSAVVFLTLGAILAGAHRDLRLRAYLLGVAVLLALLVGASRVYLGVHWPTDVLAGWTAGAAWALLCWAIAERLRRRGQVEQAE